MMGEALEFNGYTVVTATNGADALSKLSAIESPCVVILDLLMPEMDGWDFLGQMRERNHFATVPVVVHTSAPARSPAGVARVLQKPMAFEKLLSVVREYCAH
jgi:two-component system response regulator MprA